LTDKENLILSRQFFKMASGTTRGNTKKLYKERSRLLVRQAFFSQRVVNQSVECAAIHESRTVNILKSRLDNLWKDMAVDHNT
jgi:hypothetical protein